MEGVSAVGFTHLGNWTKFDRPLPKYDSCGILVVEIMEGMETIAKAIRPITYKKTFGT